MLKAQEALMIVTGSVLRIHWMQPISTHSPLSEDSTLASVVGSRKDKATSLASQGLSALHGASDSSQVAG